MTYQMECQGTDLPPNWFLQDVAISLLAVLMGYPSRVPSHRLTHLHSILCSTDGDEFFVALIAELRSLGNRTIALGFVTFSLDTRLLTALHG